jgi:hypothetical protein
MLREDVVRKMLARLGRGEGVMLHRRWSAEAWSQARVEFK